MQINIKQFQKQFEYYFARLQDVQFLGQVAFVIIVLLISWSGVRSIQTNYALQKDITGLKQHNDLQKLENENIRLGNDYYKSNQYLELSARENFGLAAPGEKQVVVPEAIALAKTEGVTVPGTQATYKPTVKRNNFEAWIDFFLHRTN
jgi:cell division protein FtsB